MRVAFKFTGHGVGDLVVFRMLMSHAKASLGDVEVDFFADEQGMLWWDALGPHRDVAVARNVSSLKEHEYGAVLAISKAAALEDAGDPRTRLRIWADRLGIELGTDVRNNDGVHRASVTPWSQKSSNILFFPSATNLDRTIPRDEALAIFDALNKRWPGVVMFDQSNKDSWPSRANIAKMISECRAVVSVDSGPMHIAGACGTPAVGISFFKPAYYFEEMYEKLVVLQARYGDKCPCGGRYSCEYGGKAGGTLPCNRAVRPAEVVGAVEVALRGEHRNGKIGFVAVPPGIGDALWSLVKVPDMKRRYGWDKVVVCPKGSGLNRAKEFLMGFDFVDDVGFVDFDIHYRDRPDVDAQGRYVYLESQQNFRGMDWLLISNGHLERGHRLEDWLPEFETDWEIGIRWKSSAEAASFAEAFLAEHGKFAVIYPGPLRGNTTDGHNRNEIMTPQDWCTICSAIRSSGRKVVVVGAHYDESYVTHKLYGELESRGIEYVNFVGKLDIFHTFALIDKSDFVVSYQAGIGIFPLYRGKRSATFWRPDGDSISPMKKLCFDEAMNGAWVPPQFAGNHLPLYYGRHDGKAVVELLEAKRWLL